MYFFVNSTNPNIAQYKLRRFSLLTTALGCHLQAPTSKPHRAKEWDRAFMSGASFRGEAGVSGPQGFAIHFFHVNLNRVMWPEIIKIVACTRCQILRPKCTKFDFGWGSAPEPTGGAYSAPDSLARFRGLLLRGGEGRGRPQGFAEMTPLLHVRPKKGEAVSDVGGGLIPNHGGGLDAPALCPCHYAALL